MSSPQIGAKPLLKPIMTDDCHTFVFIGQNELNNDMVHYDSQTDFDLKLIDNIHF